MEIVRRNLTKSEFDKAAKFFINRPLTDSAEFESWLCAAEAAFVHFGCPWGFLQICNDGQFLAPAGQEKRKKGYKRKTKKKGGKSCRKLQT